LPFLRDSAGVGLSTPAEYLMLVQSAETQWFESELHKSSRCRVNIGAGRAADCWYDLKRIATGAYDDTPGAVAEKGEEAVRAYWDKVRITYAKSGAVFTCSECLKLEKRFKEAVDGRLTKIIVDHMVPPLPAETFVGHVLVGQG